ATKSTAKAKPSTMSVKAPKAPKKVSKKAREKKEKFDQEMSKLALKWSSLYQRAQSREAPVYKMTGAYPAKSPIKHEVLGWGFILSNVNDRLEVLFKDGVRYLISNYQPKN